MYRASQVAQVVKNLPPIPGTLIWSLIWEDPLEKEMTTHSSILAWEVPWTEEPGGVEKSKTLTEYACIHMYVCVCVCVCVYFFPQ